MKLVTKESKFGGDAISVKNKRHMLHSPRAKTPANSIMLIIYVTTAGPMVSK